MLLSRLFPEEVKVPLPEQLVFVLFATIVFLKRATLAFTTPVLFTVIVLLSKVTFPSLNKPPPWVAPVFPLMVTLIRVASPLLSRPPPVFEALCRKVTSVSFGDTEGQALKRTLAEKMELVDLDNAGRIMLPEWMATAAGLGVGKEAVMNGMFDCFQIWSPERYESTRAGVAAKAPNAFRTI